MPPRPDHIPEAAPALLGEGERPTEQRRALFARLIGLASGVISLALAIPLVGYVLAPALTRREASWVKVGPTNQLHPGAPVELEYTGTVKDGWRVVTAKKAVWAVKQPAGGIVVFSPLCPHLGCGFRWDAGDHQFQCPCHGSVYDVNGNVLAGPAPRSLDVLPSRVVDGQLSVLYKEFKSGLDHPVEL